MRKILFRGKRTENNEWFYGDLIQGVDHHNETATSILPRVIAYTEERVSYLVDPETVGQYTGINDMNGKMIFDGDILKFGEYIWTVEWKADRLGYGYVEKADRMLEFDGGNCEIIGNIHDNPELIKEREWRKRLKK